MAFTVSYTTDVRPTDLPAGATVERVPALPLNIDTGSRTVRVVKDDGLNYGAYLTVQSSGYRADFVDSSLTIDQTRELAHALLDTIGEHPDDTVAVVDSVTKLRDADGDIWYRVGQDKWKLDHWADTSGEALEWVSRHFSPLTVVTD